MQDLQLDKNVPVHSVDFLFVDNWCQYICLIYL